MSSLLNKQQCQIIKRAWQNFRTVINSFPLSDNTILLLFHANNLLTKLENSPVDLIEVEIITTRVNRLAQTSSMILAIDDMLKFINEALASISPDKLIAMAD